MRPSQSQLAALEFMDDLQRREERTDRKERLRHTVERFNKICYRKEPGYVAEWLD